MNYNDYELNLEHGYYEEEYPILICKRCSDAYWKHHRNRPNPNLHRTHPAWTEWIRESKDLGPHKIEQWFSDPDLSELIEAADKHEKEYHAG